MYVESLSMPDRNFLAIVIGKIIMGTIGGLF